jgi:hypothetical protein
MPIQFYKTPKESRERRSREEKAPALCPCTAPNKALHLTAYSLRLAALCSGFRQQVSASVRLLNLHCMHDWKNMA